MNRSFTKVAIPLTAIVVIIAVAIAAAVVVDKLDFVARWLWHLAPYKNNIERVFYFCVLAPALLLYLRQTRKYVKGVKMNVGGWGFEIEFENDKPGERDDCDSDNVKSQVSHKSKAQHFPSLGQEKELTRKVLSRLNEEMNMDFVENTILKRGECHYRPDGFAINRGRAYIVEIKVGDQLSVLDIAIQQLKTFAEMVPNRKLTDITVIFCLVTNRSVSDFMQRKNALTATLDLSFIFRVFKPSELENI